MPDNSVQVAVIGAGIGGMTAALTLRDRGVDVRVYEQAHEMKALGAGVAVAPNGSRILEGLGLGPAVSALAGRFSHYAFYTANGDPLGSTPLTLGDPAKTWFLHRGEFQQALADALPDGTLHLGKRCARVEETADGVDVWFADGSSTHAALVVGADGAHSVLQGVVGDPAGPVSEGIMAYRGLVPAERLGDVLDLTASSMWLGPQASFLVYPVSAGRLVNVVAFVPTTLDVEESWTAPGDLAELAASYRGWDERVQAVIAAMDETFRWGIYDREPLARWSTDRITLLGDSAHAVTPHLGQGANQAIEDAATLAELLADAGPADVPGRLREYESVRLPRTRMIREQARTAGRIYRSDELGPQEQADRLATIYAGIDIDDYDAAAVARSAHLGG